MKHPYKLSYHKVRKYLIDHTTGLEYAITWCNHRVTEWRKTEDLDHPTDCKFCLRKMKASN